MKRSDDLEAAMRRRGKRLCWAGWGVFGLSMFLPAIYISIMSGGAWWRGWECAVTAGQIAWALVSGDGGTLGWMDWYYGGFTLANALLLTSPLVVRLFRRRPKRLRLFGFALALAALYSLSYLALGLSNGVETVRDLHVGYYAWVVSFGLTAFGAFHLAISERAASVDLRPKAITKTEEELAAERELEEFLGTRASAAVEVKPADTVETLPLSNLRTVLA
jgi:hypothetical protein